MAKEKHPFDVWNDEQVFGAQDLALAYGDHTQTLFGANFLKKIQARETKEFVILKNDTKIIYETLFKLSAVHKILKDLGSWFEFGYLSSEQADMLR